MSRFLRRLLAGNLLFLLGFVLCLFLNTRVLAGQGRMIDRVLEAQILLANSENLTPQPPSLQGKGEPESPSRPLRGSKLRRGGVGEGSASLSQLVEQGDRFYQAGKFKEAIAIWQQVLSQISISQERAIVYNYLGAAFRQIGQSEQAIASWEKAIEIYRRASDRNSQIQLARLLTEQAQAYSELGQQKRALKILQSALEIARRISDPITQAAAQGAIGNAYYALGDYEQALAAQQNSLRIALELNSNAATDSDKSQGAENNTYYLLSPNSITIKDSYIQTALNNLGNLYTKRAERYFYQAKVADIEGDEQEKNRLIDLVQQDITSATNTFQESIQLGATDVGTVKALLNLSRLLERRDNVITPQPNLVNLSTISNNRAQALKLLNNMPDSRDKAYGLINLAVGIKSLNAAKLLADAIAVSRNIGDLRAESFALGSLAQLYEASQQYQEAMDLNRQALFAAQKVNAVDSLYRWQWQGGRILKASGKIETAISYYQQAIASLQSIRSDILATNKDLQFDFRDSVEPVYRQMMDILLTQAQTNPTNSQQNLTKVLDTLELLKLAELQNFFGDECVQVAKDNAQNNSDIANTGAAIIYSVILEDRTAMIVRFPDGKLKAYTVAMGEAKLQQEIDQLRLLLEKRSTDEYLPQAQEIYDLLIRPMAEDLASLQPKYLVFINDGVLRKVPMAALHDGQEFLIQKYAIATTPSLNLTATKSNQRRNLKALSVGLTVERPPFAPLTNVATEVAEVQTILGGTKLLDKDFTIARLETEIKENNFPIIHMATHGKFGVDAANTFLISYDAKISIDQIDYLLRNTAKNIGSKNKQPVELLTLSACQTAAGDNRAALGIAGVAVRAGVKTALASLWFINDEATVQLIEEFYKQLRQPNTTKAEALQKAQLKLIASEDYDHPAVWSAFILIGNWL